MSQLNFDDLEIGQSITPYQKEITLVQNVMYASATWDFFRIHYDAEYARNKGLKGPVCDGQMLGALLVRMVSEWAGEAASLKRLKLSYKKMAYVGDTLKFTGRVRCKSSVNCENQVICELSIENQKGEIIVSDAEAVLSFRSIEK